MPTVLRIEKYRFFFYSNERQEPPHIHVESAENYGKVWLAPIRMVYFVGYTNREMKRIVEIVTIHEQYLLEAWNEHFTH